MNRLTVPHEAVPQMFGTAGSDSLLIRRDAADRAITGTPVPLNIKLGLHSWIKKNESTVAYMMLHHHWNNQLRAFIVSLFYFSPTLDASRSV